MEEMGDGHAKGGVLGGKGESDWDEWTWCRGGVIMRIRVEWILFIYLSTTILCDNDFVYDMKEGRRSFQGFLQ